MSLHATSLELGYGPRRIVEIAELRLAPGTLTCIIGPNGCGKSTLLRALGGLLKPAAGRVCLDGRPLPQWKPKMLARRLASLPQAPSAPDGISVRQLVGHGRYPHQGLLASHGVGDDGIIDWAMQATRIAHLQTRVFSTLSGGERQRAWLAMTLAQRADILLLDEPTTWLDMGHQAELLELLAALQREHGLTIAMVLHDINQASQYADRLLAMRDGRIVADGPPAQVVDGALTETLFGLRTEQVYRDLGGRRVPFCLPLPASAAADPAAASAAARPSPTHSTQFDEV
ncbi:ABC transporter ATP-binding protein [Pseudothauera nasutitermitis]|uniref:ABC transporter ATP-binding protein n=1 Tax=Pseudothauera nasutitermitis TaxID=2565930 RepID=A0A4S4APD7_9RHOO|nr:ABC transporter ATP-binding protein [Pseudothauera nasutitermitis]THF61513.1 ABC transporter ATP-binding protein [Pseudothauera nasutitermitis]